MCCPTSDSHWQKVDYCSHSWKYTCNLITHFHFMRPQWWLLKDNKQVLNPDTWTNINIIMAAPQIYASNICLYFCRLNIIYMYIYICNAWGRDFLDSSKLKKKWSTKTQLLFASLPYLQNPFSHDHIMFTFMTFGTSIDPVCCLDSDFFDSICGQIWLFYNIRHTILVIIF